jgi:hypothetical protein
MPTLIIIGPVILEEKLKMLKSNRQMSDGQWAVKKAHLNFQLRCAKNIKIFKKSIHLNTISYQHDQYDIKANIL